MLKFNFDKFLSPSKKREKQESEKKEEKSQAWKSLDEENLYNLPGYSEEFHDQEFEADNQVGGDLGELMEKYGLEEWELKDKAKECLKYYRGEINNPFVDNKKTKEILDWYLDYLPTENEYGLALSEEELNRLDEKEKEDLANLYNKRMDIEFSIAELNNNIREIANVIRAGQMSQIYSTNVNEAKNELDQLKEEAKNLYREMHINSKSLYSLEEKAFTDPDKIEKDIEKIKKEIEKDRSEKAERDYQSAKEKKPFYTEAERELHKKCLDYLRRDKKKKEVPEYHGDKLSHDQIDDMAREGAIDRARNGEMIKGNFFAEEFKGKRQLAYVEKFKDEKTKEEKRIKYIYVDDELAPGYYAFKVDPATMFVTKNNPNSAMAYINLVVNLNKKKIQDQRKTA
jgi:hypothetical protein